MAAKRKIEPALTAPHKLAYTYKRSLGPVLGALLHRPARASSILGVRRADGSVLVPPKEYDPDTGEALSELVAVADSRRRHELGLGARSRARSSRSRSPSPTR